MRDARSPIDGIMSPFGVFIDGSAAFSPVSLFTSGSQGVWLDPSDLSTMFTDRAGTTPVVTPGQTVALMLDESKGLTLGSELVTNGDFSSGTSGWVGSTSTLSTVSGQLVATSNTTFGVFYPASPLTTVPGRTYVLQFDILSANFSALRVGTFLTGNNVAGFGNPGSTGTFKLSFVAQTTTSYLWVQVGPAVAGSCTFDNFSVKELPGNHATQATAAFKSTYQTTPQRLQFDGSDDRMTVAYNPTTSGSLAVRINGTTASRVVMGSQSATDGRAFIALAADGSLGAGIGAQSTSTIKGATDVRGVWTTGVVTWDGTTVRLYQNGVEVYSGAQSGAVNTTVPLRVGCLNSNGTDGAFWAGGIGAAIALGRVMTPAEISSLHTLWSTIQ